MSLSKCQGVRTQASLHFLVGWIRALLRIGQASSWTEPLVYLAVCQQPSLGKGLIVEGARKLGSLRLPLATSSQGYSLLSHPGVWGYYCYTGWCLRGPKALGSTQPMGVAMGSRQLFLGRLWGALEITAEDLSAFTAHLGPTVHLLMGGTLHSLTSEAWPLLGCPSGDL